MILESVLVAGATGLATLATEVIKPDVGGSLGKFFYRDINESLKLTLFQASREYIRTYSERHGTLKVLGMRKPLALESVYTGVRLLEHRGLKEFQSIKDLETAFRTKKEKKFENQIQTKPGINVANEEQFLMVVGSPGAGKSTFLRRIGLEALKQERGQYAHRVIPVLVELKEIKASPFNLQDIISNELKKCGFPKAGDFTQKALTKGSLLILFDGLDEVPLDTVDEVISKINDFVDRYHKNRYIASCRAAAYRSNFRRFIDVAMAEFDEQQIQRFIHNWFSSGTDEGSNTAHKCWQILQNDEHTGARELAQTPLLLTFLCLVYDRSQTFPENRSVLYQKALRILLEEWAAEKRILQDEIYKGLNVELEEILLAEIAFKGVSRDELFFSKKDIVRDIKFFISNNLNAPQSLGGESILDTITIQQGIFVERAESIYSFSHVTLQEYLAAQHIVDNNLIDVLVERHLADKRWREVFLLVAGLLRGGGDAMLLKIEKQSQTLTLNSIRSSTTIKILKWVDRLSRYRLDSCKPFEKRAEVIIFALELVSAHRLINSPISQSQEDLEDAILRDLTADLLSGLIRADQQKAYKDRARIRDKARNRLIAIQTKKKVYQKSFSQTVAESLLLQAQDSLYSLCSHYTAALVFDLSFARELGLTGALSTSSCRKLIEGLKKGKKQYEYFSREGKGKAVLNKAINFWLRVLSVPVSPEDIGATELSQLHGFIEVNRFIFSCKKSAVRVSPRTWSDIECRILSFPSIHINP